MTMPDSTNDSSLIVGIGASAGGLDAFSELLSHLPSDTGMGFVLVQHLSPNQESLLSELLDRTTSMPVVPAEEGMAVQANCVYVIPPHVQMTIAQGQLHLADCEQVQGRVKTIDVFLESLATDQKNKAIAVVLSGSNDDGALGVCAIRAEGGIVFAQDRESAEFSEMPAAAIATGKVDFVLPPAKIAEELVNLKQHPYLGFPRLASAASETPPLEEDKLTVIFRLLQRQTGVDFASYKPATFQRRLRRRMALTKCLNLSAYVQYLHEQPNEIQSLYQDGLITVTSFFRDPSVYSALQKRVFSQLLQQTTSLASIRIWVPGCATGEEAYSLAICLLENLQTLLINPVIQIFGTDISDRAIEIARTGFYPEHKMEDVSAERRECFFNEVDGGYQVKKSVRELCIFARQDLSSDPPFSEIDLLSCRNVLIYFKSSLQKRVLSFFHYSLKPTGFLVLGNSESIGDTTELFDGFDTQSKIYTRRAVPSRLNFDFIANYYPQEAKLNHQQRFSASFNRSNLQQWADQVILSRFGPAGVMVNENLEILQFRGDTSAFLRLPAGEPSYSLLKLIRPSLLVDLRMAIEEAMQQGIAARRQLSPQALSDLPEADLILEVIPFQTSNSAERCYLILFERQPLDPLLALSEQVADPKIDTEALDPEIRKLRQELADSRQTLLDTQTLLQLTIEDKESTNQELIAANEEILSSNEELKSTNEELQTAKEEIQSANEELKTTNQELHDRNAEARHANDDLLNLLTNVQIPILMLSDDLRIRRFTPAAQTMFSLIPTDIGRPISDLRFNIVDADLETLVREVIANLNPVEQEVQDQYENWFMLRIRPYRTTDNKITGATVALIDIGSLKATEQSLLSTQVQLEDELSAMNQVQTLSSQLFSCLNLETLLEQVLDATLHLLQADMGYVQLYNSERQVLEIVAHIGLDAEFLDCFREVRVDNESAHSPTTALGERVTIEDVQTNPAYVSHRQMAAATGYQAVRSIPLIDRKGQLLGAIAIYFKEPHCPAVRELRILELYGRMVSESLSLSQAQRDGQMFRIRARTAEATIAAKDEFLSMLSHELRTPLTSISAWTQLMEENLLNEGQEQEAIAAIRESAQTQTKLIEDLLDVTRIAEQRFELVVEDCDLIALLRKAVSLMQPQLQQKGLALDMDVPPGLVQLQLDSLRIRQVLTNLLTNAIKFTPAGRRISLRLVDESAQVQIQVSDTGMGIAPDQLPHIFKQFKQADSSNTRRTGGLGLGLYLVKSIVEAHGGTVAAESAGIGQGTTFTLFLPKSQENRRKVTAKLSRPALPRPLRSLDGIHILLVEDDVSLATVISIALEQAGAMVTAVESAAEALAQLSQTLPDLLLSDIGLPDVNGYELMRQVRELSPEKGGNLRAIALSGYVDPRSVNQALEVGFQAHLSKPVDLHGLAAQIADLVERS